jgi:UDP-N-acetyl-D-glucosamine dehydrogenase
MGLSSGSGRPYKDIDDLRESPSLTIIELLQRRARRLDITTLFPFVGRGRNTIYK